MQTTTDFLLVLVLLMNFLILGTGELRGCIRSTAFQGVLLSLLPLILHGTQGSPRVYLVAVGAAVIKGIVIPKVLKKAMRDARIRDEVDPYIGFTGSLLLCGLGTGMAFFLAGKLPLAEEHRGLLVVPASLATMWCGILILTSRRKAISQVVGYLVLENGIFLFGLLLVGAVPFLVEFGVLLDLVVGVFVMGIVLDHIQKEFASMDTERLSALREE